MKNTQSQAQPYFVKIKKIRGVGYVYLSASKRIGLKAIRFDLKCIGREDAWLGKAYGPNYEELDFLLEKKFREYIDKHPEIINPLIKMKLAKLPPAEPMPEMSLDEFRERYNKV